MIHRCIERGVTSSKAVEAALQDLEFGPDSTVLPVMGQYFRSSGRYVALRVGCPSVSGLCSGGLLHDACVGVRGPHGHSGDMYTETDTDTEGGVQRPLPPSNTTPWQPRPLEVGGKAAAVVVVE
jgi:hypothetical protein